MKNRQFYVGYKKDVLLLKQMICIGAGWKGGGGRRSKVHFSVQISPFISFASASMENILFFLIDYFFFDLIGISTTQKIKYSN
jgi:hypothetical protein